MKDRKNTKQSKYDTAKIPLNLIEKELIDSNRQQQNCNKNVRTKEQHSTYSGIDSKNAPVKKENKFFRVFFSIILVISMLCGALSGYSYSLCSKINYTKSASNTTLDLTNIKNKVYNVLLIGTDKEEDNGTSRSDSMILVTINTKEKAIKLTSFMRDLWVEIPGHDHSRLNAAYSIGGPELLIKTISKNFDIRIDNYILVNFDMFKDLIDGIGGVSIDITDAEAEFINRTTHAKVTPGENTLNGDYALIYCRIRKLDSDFMRTQRQRKVITAIVNKIRTQSILKTANIASDVLPFITTDISPLKMTIKLFGAISYLDYSTEQIRIPADGTYQNKTINSQAVLVPDIEENISIVKDFIY